MYHKITPKKLTWLEKKACKVLSHLKWNEKDEFYKCPHNELVMRIASILLKGRNPVDFMVWLFDESYDNPSLKNLL